MVPCGHGLSGRVGPPEARPHPEARGPCRQAARVETITQTGAPTWGAEIFDRLRAANGGTLGGFFDVFAWREPGEVGFYEAKGSGDSIRDSQRRLLKLALDLHHRSQQFTIIKIPA